MTVRIDVNRAMLAGAILASAATSAEARPWASGTYVYADLCTEGGERAGRRITLRRSPGGDAVTYEEAARNPPVQARHVAVEEGTKMVSFMVETDSGTVSFEGRLATEALTGTIEDGTGAHVLRLRRVLRSHADEPCRGETTRSLGAATR